jgi:hypothetical protein
LPSPPARPGEATSGFTSTVWATDRQDRLVVLHPGFPAARRPSGHPGGRSVRALGATTGHRRCRAAGRRGKREHWRRALAVAEDRYKFGVDSYLNVITAQTTLLANQRTAMSIRLSQMTASVQLIKALGGSWDISQLPSEREVRTGMRLFP